MCFESPVVDCITINEKKNFVSYLIEAQLKVFVQIDFRVKFSCLLLLYPIFDNIIGGGPVSGWNV